MWDTVGSLGIPIPLLPRFITRRWTFHDTELSRSVRNAYHALAIDEQRGPFKPDALDQAPKDEAPTRCSEQRWFAGVHSRRRRRLPRARPVGDPAAAGSRTARLRLRARARAGQLVGQGNPSAALHDSLSFFYRVLGPVDRNLMAIDGEPINASLAPSVKARRTADAAYDPPGLADWLAREAVAR